MENNVRTILSRRRKKMRENDAILLHSIPGLALSYHCTILFQIYSLTVDFTVTIGKKKKTSSILTVLLVFFSHFRSTIVRKIREDLL